VTHPTLHTQLCELFGVEYPIVQTGMGWVAGANLASATSNAGGLGILASATMTYDELAKAIHEVRSRTDRPFGVNLRSDQPDVDDRIALLVREGVTVASFAQAPGERLVKMLKDEGVVVMPTVGARRHAEKVAEWGVDAVIAQGAEGGGHTGAVPTTLLLSQVCDAVDIPVLGAGGFHDGRGLVAALAPGAEGINMGTRFMCTKESPIHQLVKERIVANDERETELIFRTMRNTSRVARNAISTKVVAMEKEGAKFEDVRELVAGARGKMVYATGDADEGIWSAGQVQGLIHDIPTCAELISRIMRDAEAIIQSRLEGMMSGALREAAE